MSISLGDAILYMKGDSSALNKDLSEAEGKTGNWVTNLGGTVNKFIGTAIVATVATATTAIVGLGVSGVKAAADLDHQMAAIAATMGKTKAEVEPLKQLIFDLSLNPELTVNAEQAAAAIEMLAANGLDMQTILDGAAEKTVALANATGADFSTAAEVATDIMSLFNIKAEEMDAAIDGITGVTVAGKFGIEDYALALAQVGGIASGMGVSLEDLNTVLAGTSSSFASGGDAGTSFKAMLQRLADPTDEMQEAMKLYGISLFDAEGKMRDMGDVANQLNQVFNGTATVTTTAGGATKEMMKEAEKAEKGIPKVTTALEEQRATLANYQNDLFRLQAKEGDHTGAIEDKQLAIQKLTNDITTNEQKLSDYQGAINAVSGAQAKTTQSTKTLTEAEKAQLAALLGGADGARTVLALADMTGEAFDELSGEVNKSGQAMDSAATRVDSLAGAWEIFMGILDAIKLQIGDALLPMVRQMVAGFTDFASKAGPVVVAFFAELAEAIQAIAASPAMAEFIATISQLIPGFEGAEGAVSGVSDVLLGLANYILPILTQAITFVMENWDMFQAALIAIGAVLAGAGIASAIATVGGVIAALVGPVGLIIGAAILLGTAWGGNWYGIRDTTMEVWATLQPIIAELITWLSVNVPLAIQFLSDYWTNVLWPAIQTTWANIQAAIQATLDFIMPYVNQAMAFIQEVITSVLAYIQDWWKQHGEAVMVIIKWLWETVLATVDKNIKFVQFIIETVTKIIMDLWQEWGDEILLLASTAWENIKVVIDAAMKQIGFIIDAVSAIIEGDWDGFMEALKNIWETGWNATKNILSNIAGAIGTIITNNIINPIKAKWDTFTSGLKTKWDTLWDGMIGIVQDSLDPFKTAIDSIMGWVESAIDSLLRLIGLQNDAGSEPEPPPGPGVGGASGPGLGAASGGGLGRNQVINFTQNIYGSGTTNAGQDLQWLGTIPVT